MNRSKQHLDVQAFFQKPRWWFAAWQPQLWCRCLFSCSLQVGASMDLTWCSNVPLDWDLGNLEEMLTSWALCHVPEQFLWCQREYYPAGEPVTSRRDDCWNVWCVGGFRIQSFPAEHYSVKRQSVLFTTSFLDKKTQTDDCAADKQELCIQP